MAPNNKYPTLHHDGTVSYWSYHQQEWIERAFHVPIEEIQAMHPYDRNRVKKHLHYEDE